MAEAIERSSGMLARARERLGGAPVTLVQADLDDLPFAPGRFATVGCFGTFHVLAEPWPALEALWRQVAPGGRLFASMLVADRRVGGAYLRALERAGEVGRPRHLADLRSAAESMCGPSVSVGRTGSMAWLRARR